MNKYQILLEYVGTKYVGWQSQKNGRSIQNTVQLYLSKLLKNIPEKVVTNKIMNFFLSNSLIFKEFYIFLL